MSNTSHIVASLYSPSGLMLDFIVPSKKVGSWRMMRNLGHKLFKLIDVMSMPLMKICPLPNGCSSNEYMKKNHILKYPWLSCFNQLKITCFGMFALWLRYSISFLSHSLGGCIHPTSICSLVVHTREWLPHVSMDLHMFQL